MRVLRLLCAILLITPAVAFGDVKLSLDVGWDSWYRSGRWTPLFVTATDDAQRQVVLELYAPHDQRYALDIHEQFVIGPTRTTIAVYAPLSYMLDETAVVLRDANSGKRLVRELVNDLSPTAPNRSSPQMVEPNHVFVGVSGNLESARLVERQFDRGLVTLAYLDPLRLPASPMGYNCLDVLILNQPDVVRLGADQQRAIADWVRAGGNLVLWPGGEPMPETGPLVEILPAKVGDNRVFDLDAAALPELGLPGR